MKLRRSLFVTKLLLTVLAGNVWALEVAESPEQLRRQAVNYEHGRLGVKQDYQQAFELYCKAALQQDAESAYSLGFMYFNGRGKPRDLGLALHWFKQAATAGDAHAQKMLARYADVTAVEDTACKPPPEIQPIVKLAVVDNPNKQVVEGWVKQIAPRYGIDPELVMAVIRAESAFKVSALSSKNAQGLMQLIPETAARFGVKDSWDPIKNIQGGTVYLHWLLRHFEGKVDLVLAAYNAGEGAVERYKGIPPYQETQEYVRQILSWYPKPVHPIPSQESGQIVARQKT